MRSPLVLFIVLALALPCLAQAPPSLSNRLDLPVKPLYPPTKGPVAAAPEAERLPRTMGDTIDDPFVIPSLPFSDSGNTCSFNHDYNEACPYTGGTAKDVVYEYVCATSTVVDISLCDSYYDTKLYVYRDTVGTRVACNDDACSGPNYSSPYLSLLEDVSLDAGHTYYIIVDGYGSACGNYILSITDSSAPPTGACCLAGYACQIMTAADCVAGGGDYQGNDTGCDPNPCLPPLGDTIDDPFVIPSLPFSDTGNTCSFNDDYDEICPYLAPGSPDLVYEYICTEAVTVDISLCDSYYDTKLYIYKDAVGTLVACNDDACSGPNYPWSYLSLLEGISFDAGHTYYIIVDGYGGSCGLYDLQVTVRQPCVVECPCGQPEGEPDCHDDYVDAHNGGCFSDPHVFGALTLPTGPAPTLICGTSGTYLYQGSQYRDTDWYWFEPSSSRSYRFTVRAEFPLVIYLLDMTQGCDYWQVLTVSPADPCQEATIEWPLTAGTPYVLVVTPSVFSGVECGSGYVVTVEDVEYSLPYGEIGEFGDAPECALAYPDLGLMGAFPTCVNVGPMGFVHHGPIGWAWFGPGLDFEPDGNAGACPLFNPNSYDQDECQGDPDAGLLFPVGHTITGPVGSETVVPCFPGGPATLGDACRTGHWGADIDILVTNSTAEIPFFVNVLADWDRSGFWAGAGPCPQGPAPEHLLVDFLVPPGFSGPLSALAPPPFQIGPQPGHVWMRFTISETPVMTADWNGEGMFEDGETEDYLVLVGDLAACCLEDGGCMMLSQADCDVQGGVHWGIGTTCTPNPCPQPPTGACCLADYACQILTEADCVAAGGDYQGDGTGCDPNPCLPPPPTGACCLADYTCQIMTEADCIAGGGDYQGDDTGCDPNPCLPIEPWEDVVLAGFDDFERSFAADYQGWILQLVERWMEPAGPAVVLDYLPFAPEQWSDATQYPYAPGTDAAANGQGSFQVGLRLEGWDDTVMGQHWFDAAIVQSEDWYTHTQCCWPAGYEQHPDYTGSWPFGHYGSIGPVTGDQLRLRLYSPGFHHENDKVEGTMFTKSGPSWTWVESGFTGIERGWNILSFPVASIHDANDLRELGVKLGSHHYVWDDLYVDNVTLGDTPYPNRYVFLTPDLAFFSETPGYDTKTVSIYYDDGGGATPLIRGFSLEIHYPSGCALVTSAAAGDLLLGPGDPTHFEYDDDGAGTLTIDWLILGQTTGAGGAGKLATVTFTAASEILDCCDAVSFNVSQCRFRDPDNIPITNLVYVGGGVSHDITPPVAAVPASPTHTAGVPTSIDDLKITWATTHDPDLGLYHCPVGMRGYYLAIDQNPSGAPDPQGAYDWFTPWSPDSTGYAAWFQDLPEGDWYVHIVAYDWLWNPSTVGHFGPVSIDKTPPGMVSGFDADITDEADRSVDLAWTNPGDADLAGVEIYRLGTAGALGSTYPEYDDDPNWAVPAWPATKAAAVAAGWTLVGQFPGTGHVDQPAARDYYYYVAFAYDGAGNYSGADAGSRDASLCYWLGDFNGTKNPNYFVDIQDVLIISLSYNRAAGHPDYNPVCDIGPTVDWGRKSLPATDNEVEFEDMIILALNYEYAQGGRTDSPPAECSGRMTAYLAQSLRGDLLEVRVLLADNPGCLKGASVELAFGSGLEYIDAAQGSLWSGGESFFIDSGDGSSVLLDAFALHGATGADGCHAIARFRVRGEAGDRSLRITEFRARSTSNSDIAGEWSLSEATDLPLPATHALFSAMPNPTVRGVTIGYALASETQVAVRIYDAAGRLVRTLVDEARPAGHAQVSWDGLRADGSAAGPGIYFYRMEAGDYQSSRKLTVLR